MDRLNNKYTNYGIEWAISTVLYALILVLVSLIFRHSMYIDNNYFGIYAILVAIVVSLLNVTIKPILIWLTLPITAMTLGTFYFVINVIILKIADIILGSHFQIYGVFMPIVLAIVISFFNSLARKYIIKPITKG